MKCTLCGREWVQYADTEAHDSENDCPLAGLIIEKGHSEWINAAIEAAKVDTRKPEECKHCETCWRIVQEQAESGIEDPSSYPCASFEKGEKV